MLESRFDGGVGVGPSGGSAAGTGIGRRSAVSHGRAALYHADRPWNSDANYQQWRNVRWSPLRGHPGRHWVGARQPGNRHGRSPAGRCASHPLAEPDQRRVSCCRDSARLDRWRSPRSGRLFIWRLSWAIGAGARVARDARGSGGRGAAAPAGGLGAAATWLRGSAARGSRVGGDTARCGPGFVGAAERTTRRGSATARA